MRHPVGGLMLPLLTAAFVNATVALAQAQQARQSDSQRTETDENDKIVEDFIQFDIGRIRDPVAVAKIKQRFAGLTTDDAVPALVRGLNKSTRMRASCPITELSGRLRGILAASKDPEVGTYVLRKLEDRDVGGYTQHIKGVFDAAASQLIKLKGHDYAEQQWKERAEGDKQRMAYVPGRKLTDLAPRDPAAARPESDESAKGSVPPDSRSPATRNTRGSSAAANPADLKKLSTAELAERLNDRESAAKVLDELYRRAGSKDAADVADHVEAITTALKDGDDATRKAAARLLGQLRSDKALPRLIDALEDANPQVRSAASTALARSTGQSFGPHANASSAETQRAIVRWRDWLGQQTR